jgi:EPS-associated MarR family transcriptional regulator
MPDEVHYRILKIIEESPDISQRELAKELGISLGKVNYCLKALLGKGILKVVNFKNSKNKIAYTYLLTPKGIEEKTKITRRFISQKMEEFEALKKEIDMLKLEL